MKNLDMMIVAGVLDIPSAVLVELDCLGYSMKNLGDSSTLGCKCWSMGYSIALEDCS